MPKSRLEYWVKKFESKVDRDRRNQADLEKKGWKSFVIWECELAHVDSLEKKIREFLEG
jgi:DNA mismatch endonuclease (patch repair protein)